MALAHPLLYYIISLIRNFYKIPDDAIEKRNTFHKHQASLFPPTVHWCQRSGSFHMPFRPLLEVDNIITVTSVFFASQYQISDLTMYDIFTADWKLKVSLFTSFWPAFLIFLSDYSYVSHCIWNSGKTQSFWSVRYNVFLLIRGTD